MATQQDLKVLGLMAKEWELSGPPGILDISDIVAVLDLAPSETLQARKSPYQSGMVDMNTLKSSAFLAPEGYADAGIP